LTVVAAGMPPLAWDPATGTAMAPYYAEPPTLYERVLGLSGGYGPSSMPHQRTTFYRGVSEEAARSIYSRLASGHAA
jgi:hypothetical protein